jgi:hypothetical protein
MEMNPHIHFCENVALQYIFKHITLNEAVFDQNIDTNTWASTIPVWFVPNCLLLVPKTKDSLKGSRFESLGDTEDNWLQYWKDCYKND